MGRWGTRPLTRAQELALAELAEVTLDGDVVLPGVSNVRLDTLRALERRRMARHLGEGLWRVTLRGLLEYRGWVAR